MSKTKKNIESLSEVSQPATPDAETRLPSQLMYERLESIVRTLHESLRDLGYDQSLSVVSNQMTDVQGRLEYISVLTEQAVNKVFNALDISMPAQDALAKKAEARLLCWSLDTQPSPESFRTLMGESRQFAEDVVTSVAAEKARLLEILMAQDFQDITGQLIKKIVVVTHATQCELQQLLNDSAPSNLSLVTPPSPATAPTFTTPTTTHNANQLVNGPSMPHVAMGQDDIDDLINACGKKNET